MTASAANQAPDQDAVIDGAALLDAIMIEIRRYLVLPEGGAEAMTLWAVHTHAFRAFQHTPRLHFTSVLEECGKSTTLDVLECLCPRAETVDNITPAALFRTIHEEHPVLLLDEADTMRTCEDSEMVSLLNSGSKKGRKVRRSVKYKDDYMPRSFDLFCPIAIAGIGDLPKRTLSSRCI